jgi:hypothetical protein
MFRLTVAPASIVNVTPELTKVGPERLYGLFADVQVVSELMMLGGTVLAWAKLMQFEKTNMPTVRIASNITHRVFLIFLSLLNGL